MNTERLNEIYNKFPKVNLEKVELSNLQFINAIVNDGKNINKRGIKFAQNREVLTKEARVLNADAKALLKGGLKIIKDFEKKAKELGVKSSNVKELKEANDVMGVMDTIIKQTEKYK